MIRPILLLADDSVTIRNVVESNFAAEGFDVKTASDGEEAMRHFVESQPDVVIADVNMPDPTGYQICEAIKDDEQTRHIPVLLTVGSFEPFDQSEAERVGADGFLTKPFQSIGNLIRKVEELLGNEDRIASPAATADIDRLYGRSVGDEVEVPDEPLSDVLSHNEAMPDEQFVDDENVDAAISLPDEQFVDDENVDAAISSPDEQFVDDVNFDAAISMPDEQFVDDVNVDAAISLPDEQFDYDEKVNAAINSPDERTTQTPLGDTGMDDEIIETSHPSSGIVYDDEVLTAAPRPDLERKTDQKEPDRAAIDRKVEGNLASISQAERDVDEPSDEFVALVARRVVEKLSDKLVREIAMETVPRITEKLIREALDEEKKK